MTRYIISEEDIPYAREFLDNPVGYHSPGLQRVLNRMRGPGWSYKYVLLVKERHKCWGLARLPDERGGAIEEIAGVEYTDLLEAERDVFKRRWFDLTGNDLEKESSITER